MNDETLVQLISLFAQERKTEREEKRQTSLASYAKEISDCASEWHTQLCNLQSLSLDEIAFATQSVSYQYNRLVLPRLLRAMAALSQHEEAKGIVTEALAILELLTRVQNDNNASNDGTRTCEAILMGQPESTARKSGGRLNVYAPRDCKPMLKGRQLTDVIVELDRHVQKINVLAGTLAKI